MFSVRHLCVFLLTFSLLFQTIIPFQLYAAEGVNTVSKAPKISLEQAIYLVKENFQIPKIFTEFSSGYTTYDDRQTWSLNWGASDGQSGSFSAKVDAVNGEIISISVWNPSGNSNSYKLPNISLKQAEKIAEETLEKLTGAKYKQLQMIKDETAIPLNLYSSRNYSFTWQRIENGLPVQGNGASIQINSDNGQIVSYRLTWTDLEFPEPENIIDELQATKAFKENKFLELKYFTPSYVTLNTKDPKQVKLVYRLRENGILDAFSGKPLLAEQNLSLGYDDLGLGNMAAKQAARESVALTPEELSEIEENASLLTAEQAIAAVKKWFDIPATYILQAMSLNKDSDLRNSKTWYFEWASFDEKPSQNISAKVNAVNGELISFRYYKPILPLTQESAQTPRISQAEAKNIAEDFLKKIQPAKFAEVKLVDSSPLNTLTDTAPGTSPYSTSVTFSYERIVDGIAFSSNGMNVTIDLNTKEITSYNLNWWDLTFPKASEAMSQNQAEKKFLEIRPLVLNYMLFYNNGNRQAKLVYMPAAEQNKVSDIMDAQTGELLNWQGTPLSDPSPRYVFNDIAGHEAEKEISVLGLAGIFGEYGNSFKPASDLTLAPLLKALLMINSNSSSDIYNLTDTAVLEKAKGQGWLERNLTASQAVSRELFSKIIIRYLGLEKIAEATDIYNLQYKDKTDISHDSTGYIALASGLNIIESSNNKFEPQEILNRADAARYIIRALEYKSTL